MTSACAHPGHLSDALVTSKRGKKKSILLARRVGFSSSENAEIFLAILNVGVMETRNRAPKCQHKEKEESSTYSDSSNEPPPLSFPPLFVWWVGRKGDGPLAF